MGLYIPKLHKAMGLGFCNTNLFKKSILIGLNTVKKMQPLLRNYLSLNICLNFYI